MIDRITKTIQCQYNIIVSLYNSHRNKNRKNQITTMIFSFVVG